MSESQKPGLVTKGTSFKNSKNAHPTAGPSGRSRKRAKSNTLAGTAHHVQMVAGLANESNSKSSAPEADEAPAYEFSSFVIGDAERTNTGDYLPPKAVLISEISAEVLDLLDKHGVTEAPSTESARPRVNSRLEALGDEVLNLRNKVKEGNGTENENILSEAVDRHESAHAFLKAQIRNVHVRWSFFLKGTLGGRGVAHKMHIYIRERCCRHFF